MQFNANVTPLEIRGQQILKWGYRLLYLEIALFLLMSMFYVSYPVTLPFTGAILSFFYVAQIWKNASVKTDVQMCTLMSISEDLSTFYFT